MNADDVLTALHDLDFPELVGPLREQLEGKWGFGCPGAAKNCASWHQGYGSCKAQSPY